MASGGSSNEIAYSRLHVELCNGDVIGPISVLNWYQDILIVGTWLILTCSWSDRKV